MDSVPAHLPVSGEARLLPAGMSVPLVNLYHCHEEPPPTRPVRFSFCRGSSHDSGNETSRGSGANAMVPGPRWGHGDSSVRRPDSRVCDDRAAGAHRRDRHGYFPTQEQTLTGFALNRLSPFAQVRVPAFSYTQSGVVHPRGSEAA